MDSRGMGTGRAGAKRIGNYGETAARGYIEAKAYIVLAKNYKSPHGEIDIIAMDGAYYVFIEVKYRRQLSFGRPAEAVSRRKQRNLIACAYTYLEEQGLSDVPCRFDIIEVFGREILEVNHIVNGFGE